jgi:hypothetical protein
MHRQIQYRQKRIRIAFPAIRLHGRADQGLREDKLGKFM